MKMTTLLITILCSFIIINQTFAFKLALNTNNRNDDGTNSTPSNV